VNNQHAALVKAEATPAKGTATELAARLAALDTNFEREALVGKWAADRQPPALSCSELHAVLEPFTFSSKKRSIAVLLYPLVSDPSAFPDLVEATFDYHVDRKEVMAAVLVSSSGALTSSGTTVDLKRLMASLDTAATSFERETAVDEQVVKQKRKLDCMQLGVVVERFPFSERKKSVLAKLYPLLVDPRGFASLLDEVLRLESDRKDVLQALKIA